MYDVKFTVKEAALEQEVEVKLLENFRVIEDASVTEPTYRYKRIERDIPYYLAKGDYEQTLVVPEGYLEEYFSDVPQSQSE